MIADIEAIIKHGFDGDQDHYLYDVLKQGLVPQSAQKPHRDAAGLLATL